MPKALETVSSVLSTALAYAEKPELNHDEGCHPVSHRLAPYVPKDIPTRTQISVQTPHVQTLVSLMLSQEPLGHRSSYRTWGFDVVLIVVFIS